MSFRLLLLKNQGGVADAILHTGEFDTEAAAEDAAKEVLNSTGYETVYSVQMLRPIACFERVTTIQRRPLVMTGSKE